MLGDSNSGVAEFLQESIDLRMETFREVLIGQMTPFKRRLELAGQRQGIILGAAGSPLASDFLESSFDESGYTEEPEHGRPGSETPNNIEIEVDSPREDAVRVANFLAKKHSDAETVAVSDSDTIEVLGAPGGTFTLDVAEVLEREFGEIREHETVASSVPSMSNAVAEKHG